MSDQPTHRTAQKLIRDSKLRMSKTTLGKLQELQAQMTRWKKKKTIATNKLETLQHVVECMAEDLAKEKLETEWAQEKKGQA